MKQKLLFDPLTNSIPRMVLPLLFFFLQKRRSAQKEGEIIWSAAGAGGRWRDWRGAKAGRVAERGRVGGSEVGLRGGEEAKKLVFDKVEEEEKKL